MVKKSYNTPVLEVVELGFGALQCASPYSVTPPPELSKHDDWVTVPENDYDI